MKTFISRQRAQYILENKQEYGALKMAFKRPCDYNPKLFEDGITQEEDKEIKRIWSDMPGWTCYMHALIRIAQEAEE